MTLSFLGAARPFTSPAEAPEPTAMAGASAVLAGEWLTVARLPLLLTRAPSLAAAPRGRGRVVIDVPGWKAPEASMWPLRAYLRHLGHDARGWGLGTNLGRPEHDAERLARRVEQLADERGEPVSLVGWSLGGVIAREVARAVPRAVARVVTYGTPVVGGPTYTLGARTFGSRECDRVKRLIEQLDRERPIQVPITAIFTRRDAVVSWPACIDRVSPFVEHVEVTATHLGLGIDADVWRIVAERLARG